MDWRTGGSGYGVTQNLVTFADKFFPMSTERPIKEFPGNPRKITEQQLMALGESLNEYGSLDGFVVNVAPGKYQDCIISGNQKNKHVNLDESEITITVKYDAPTATGTVAVGNVSFRGELFPYREVAWSEDKCEIANIRANNLGGMNDPTLLAMFDDDILRFSGINLEFEKALDMFRNQFDYAKVPEAPEPGNLVGDMKNKPATMKITFASAEDLQEAEQEIAEIIGRYEGAFFSISAGQA